MSRLWYTLYQWHRHRLAGWSLFRWAMFFLAAVTVLSVGGWVPGGHALALLTGGLFFALLGMALWARRVGFVRFRVQPSKVPAPAIRPLQPGERLSLRVTGSLQVKDQEQLVVNVAGFMEAFRGGEHVVAVYLPPSRYAGVAVVPREQEGMWYAFLPVSSELRVVPGQVQVNGIWWEALQVTWKEARRTRRLFLAFPSSETWARAWHTLTRATARSSDDRPE